MIAESVLMWIHIASPNVKSSKLISAILVVFPALVISSSVVFIVSVFPLLVLPSIIPYKDIVPWSLVLASTSSNPFCESK